MCERVSQAKVLAKKKGLDPSLLHCPPDRKAICIPTEEDCLTAILASRRRRSRKLSGPDNLAKFYGKVAKSLEVMQTKHP